jgi:predicted transposase/invertase (TIGR01784 family)
LFYWAKLYASQIGRGQSHAELEPCVSIFLLNFTELPGLRLHSTFRVLEVSSHEPFSEALELHIVELPKLLDGETDEETELVRWARFLAANSDEQLAALAKEDPVMQKAKEALDLLSAEPSAQELARQREFGMIGYQLDLQAARRQGEAAGRADGELKGRANGLHEGRADAFRRAAVGLQRARNSARPRQATAATNNV